MSWKNKIGSCFGSADMIYAIHPSDIKSANELVKTAMEEGVGFNEFCTAMEN
ncbi:hypothetical protein I2494_18120 [Budviciaceae bacterium BWR-B9]|uniref:Uncharacterized protein n=1 Tax=Limnobaculum allomyrinae TaxID=2791986 RepID=A0ABS1IV12_9GAMM|nr:MULTISPECIES: hypothetical protein [Limnobaculum]MBK5145596.1 hypothetical protein [Limnobaculum allomyrinae]MBV7693715.1 hypothetical protein [Limnobaculum sp. M2-1]